MTELADHIKEIFRNQNHKNESLKKWINKISLLDGKICSKNTVSQLRAELLIEHRINQYEKILKIYDEALWVKKFTIYKIDSIELVKLQNIISLYLESDLLEFERKISEYIQNSNKEDFSDKLSNEVSKQFTLVGTINLVALLMKKVTNDFNFDHKFIFVIDLIILTALLSVIFNLVIQNKTAEKYFISKISFLLVLIISFNIFCYWEFSIYLTNMPGLLFISFALALYISVAFNSFLSFYNTNKTHIKKGRFSVLAALIIVLEFLFFVALFA